MQPILFIDLVKAGKKGMRWKTHKYIARILLPDGQYAYIKPDEDEGHFDHINGQWLFRLAPGASLASIINRHLWGGYTGETNQAGVPKAPDGFFRTYLVVPNSELKMHKQGMQTREDVRDKIFRRKGKQYKDAISSEKVGDYTIFTFPKVPVVGQNDAGKNRYGGYINIEWNSTVTGKYRYEPSKDLLNHQVTEPGDIALANKDITDVPEKRKVGPTPEGEIKNRPYVSKETQDTLGVSVDEKTDPLTLAKLLKDRIYARIAKKHKGKLGSAVAPGQDLRIEVPKEWSERYGGEPKLLEALQERPATTLVSLGVLTPTRHSHALLKRIEEEWRRDVVRGSRSGWEAHKWTELYNKYKEKDDADGIDMTDPNSRLRKLRSQLSNDLIQEGFEHLHRVVLGFDPDKVKRLDNYIATSLRNHMNRLSAKWARDKNTTAELVEEHNVEEAAHKMRQTVPLSPEDAAELNRLTPVALTTINRVLNTEHFPDTYRKILVSRLFLNDERVERAEIAARAEKEAGKRAEADAEGKEYKRRDPTKMTRDWEDVAHKLKKVTDPISGEEVDLTTLPTSTRNRKLLQWFNEGIDKLRRELSVGAKPKDIAHRGRRDRLAEKLGMPEAKLKWHEIEVEADPTDYTPQEKIYHTAAGDKKKVVRLLTSEGQAVKRYFELEAKLAGAARQHGTIKEQIAELAYPDAAHREVDKTKIPQVHKLPEHKVGPLKHVLLIPAPKETINLVTGEVHRHKTGGSMSPAIGFFSASQNQHLARKLGINLSTIAGGGGAGGAVWHQPGVALGTKAQRELATVETHYQALERYRKASDDRLSTANKRNSATIKTLQAIGQWTRNATTGASEWAEGSLSLSKLHEAAATLQSAVSVVQQKAARRSKLRQEFREAQASVGPAEDQVHLTDSVLKYKLAKYQPTEQEKNEVTRARQRYESISNKIGSVVPDVKHLYDSTIDDPKNFANNLSIARAKVQARLNDHRNQEALIAFELERRKTLHGMKKSLMGSYTLVAAIHMFDFELGRLDAALEVA